MTSSTPAAGSIRVFLVDDENDCRADLRRGLESAGLSIAGDASSAMDAARQLPDLPVDVVIVDTVGTGADLGDVSRAAAGSAVVALSASGDPDAVLTALASGADGYVVKDEALEEMAAAVTRAAAYGASLVSPRVAKLVMARLRELEPAAPPASLTPEELEILRALADGRDPRAIADGLGVTPREVSAAVDSIRAKLGVEPTRHFAHAA